MNNDEILINVSDSENPKLLKVIGNNNKAEAKIAGITPAVLILSGKCEDYTSIDFISHLSFWIIY